jgi:hypothetical protein
MNSTYITDERDSYVTNLKGQLYLLTIENEILKQSQAASAPSRTPTVTQFAAAQAEPPSKMPATTTSSSPDLDAASRAASHYQSLEETLIPSQPVSGEGA